MRKRNLLVFGSLGLIVLGIALVSVVDRLTTPNDSTSDIRAHAASSKNLKANATIIASDPIKGTLTVNDLYFADDSRSGEAKNLGPWIVTAPASFNFITAPVGTIVVIEINARTFLVSKHTFTAISITAKM